MKEEILTFTVAKHLCITCITCIFNPHIYNLQLQVFLLLGFLLYAFMTDYGFSLEILSAFLFLS